MATSRRLDLKERIHVIRYYYETSHSFTRIINEWHEHFPTKSPSKSTMQTLVSKFEATGCVTDAKRTGAPTTIRTEENADLLAAAYTQSPKKSQRRASAELGISRTSVQRIMKEIGLKPYRPRLLHALNEDDFDRRVQFCENFITQFNDDPTFVDKIIWTDEATFKLNGRINRHNAVYWADENPHEILTKEVNTPGVTVWGGLTSDGLLGPFFFDDTVTATSYLNMLEDKVWPIISRRPNAEEIIFQQDGAPPHFALIVRTWLDQHFPNRWMGRRGPIEWPARSPDLSPPDFFLWGVLKDKVYQHGRPQNINHLKDLIRREWATITPQMCERVTHSVIDRFEDCINANGGHFELFR